jgi:archaellum component FlaC
MKDVKKRHLKERAAKKIKEENNRKEAKAIQEIAKKYKSNWREELINEGEWQPVASGAPTNAVTQTFGYFDGGFPVPNSQTGQQVTTTLSGIGLQGVESSTTIDLGFGETMNVDAPTYNQLAMAGYTPPLKMMRRGTPEDTNPKLDASQEFVQKIGADVMMNARVEDAVKEIKEKAKKVRDLTNRITELRKLAERQSKKISKMRDDGLKKIDAKYDERQKVRDRMVRKFEASFPSLRYTISGAMQITDKADSDRYYAEQDAFYAKVDATWDAMTKKIDAERKTFLEKMDKLHGSTVGQYNQEIFNISQYERPKAEAEYRDALDRHDLQRPSYYDDSMFDAFSNALDALAEAIANKSGVGVSKDMFDYYLDNWMKNPTNERLNLNNIFKPHLNTLRKLMPQIENEIRLFQSTGSSPEEIQRHINKYWNDVISRQMPTDLRNSLGNGSTLDYQNWLKTGNWEISKNFVFTEPRDFQGRFGGKLEFILKHAPELYARYKSLIGGRGINLEQYTNKPMKYKVIIGGNKTKSTNKTINKIKSMSKERATRKALSLDEPIVRSSKKSKKKRG